MTSTPPPSSFNFFHKKNNNDQTKSNDKSLATMAESEDVYAGDKKKRMSTYGRIKTYFGYGKKKAKALKQRQEEAQASAASGSGSRQPVPVEKPVASKKALAKEQKVPSATRAAPLYHDFGGGELDDATMEAMVEAEAGEGGHNTHARTNHNVSNPRGLFSWISVQYLPSLHTHSSRCYLRAVPPPLI